MATESAEQRLSEGFNPSRWPRRGRVLILVERKHWPSEPRSELSPGAALRVVPRSRAQSRPPEPRSESSPGAALRVITRSRAQSHLPEPRSQPPPPCVPASAT